MSYPDPPPPPNQFTPHPSPGGFWPPLYMENEQPDLAEQFNPPPYKRPRNFENAPNFALNPRVNAPPVPGSKGIGNIFYKTRICAKFTQGMCRNGETCSFAHGVEDLREPPPNWQDYIQEKDRSGGNGSSSTGAEDQRMNRRMKICKYYSKEECPYGEKCNFLHERPFPPNFDDDMRFKRESSVISIGTGNFEREVPGQRESTVISIGTTNSSGDVFWKTKLCSKWDIGQCPYGDRCHYAHGVSDLKVPDARVEAESMLITDAAPVPVNPLPSSVSVMAPPKLTTAANNGEDKNKLKWKVGKKINRIYGDWLDDGSPPRYLPNEEEEM